jgi:uncharacterized protein
MTTDMTPDHLRRIAEALERLAPAPAPAQDFTGADAFVWSGDANRLRPVRRVSRVPLALLLGIDRQKETLLANTQRFARGLPANNALLWGARGMGKSSLVKAVHAACLAEGPERLALVEIHREDIETLPALLRLLDGTLRRCLLFCDDLSFDAGDARYKPLKAVLEGGIEGRPPNVLFYATSNRRHMMPRDLIENEQADAINPRDVVDDKLSLSDRFGLWLGFHACSQDDYLAMIAGYISHFQLEASAQACRADALEWATTRGARSGRVAFQFIQDLAGRLGNPLS